MSDYLPLNYEKLRVGLNKRFKNWNKIKHIMIWQNGNVSITTFDKSRIPECNGCILDPKVVENINKHYCDETKVSFGDGFMGKVTTMDLSWWFKQNEVTDEKG